MSTNNQYPAINIRHWWKPNESRATCSTTKGLILNGVKWGQFNNTMLVIRDFVPEFNDDRIGCEEDHQNQRMECNFLECGMY